jgi:hypothetical protein
MVTKSLDFKNSLPYLWCHKQRLENSNPFSITSLRQILSGIPVSMTRILMILPPSMVPLKKTMKSDTFLSMAIIWHHTVATHHTCCEEEFYDTCELPDHEAWWMTYSTLFIRKFSVIFMEYIHPKYQR